MRDIPADMRITVTQIEQSAMLDLYEVDLSRFGGNVYRFHDGMNGLLKPVIWQGNRYDPYPVQVTGLSMTAQGASARPKMTFANIDGLLTAINNDYDDALGAIVTRRQVMEQYLDAVNFPDGNNQADPSREAVQKFVIEQRENSDSDFVTYVLALPTETDNAQIPARVIQADICPWRYRGQDCGYDGPPVADEKDQPTNEPTKDQCSHKYRGCKLRHSSVLPFGGFLGSNKLG
ncbi:phage minor tail protein L [Morganella morganii]|uniref:phage minor tail protein L n=1 Tax=Morganella morganii TaxID=582 RepID=UPI000290D30F|nr:phage minor tail protein L [Morganella morganii]AVK37788.1 phage minor tail protein L [Morganella morganii]ELO7536104.1 phage minor tail protein L [Morganella morganii]EMP49844.1 Phage minor tail protein [Morganella morganii SC01]MBM7211544.1 phage minor tail protein L [Morganella morganii]MBN4017374.1 phage minor tail protein L [Morganella morganii]